MLTSLCVSPITLKHLITWYNDLSNEIFFLGELVDIEENTYGYGRRGERRFRRNGRRH